MWHNLWHKRSFPSSTRSPFQSFLLRPSHSANRFGAVSSFRQKMLSDPFKAVEASRAIHGVLVRGSLTPFACSGAIILGHSDVDCFSPLSVRNSVRLHFPYGFATADVRQNKSARQPNNDRRPLESLVKKGADLANRARFLRGIKVCRSERSESDPPIPPTALTPRCDEQ